MMQPEPVPSADGKFESANFLSMEIISFEPVYRNPRRCSSLAWHPTIPTQVVCAYEDDNNPVMQLWDLRSPSTYLHEYVGHQKVRLMPDSSPYHLADYPLLSLADV